jgi:hypothetical protein
MGSQVPQSILDQQEFERQRMEEHQRRVNAEALGGAPAGVPAPNPYQDFSNTPLPSPPKIGLAEMLMKYISSALPGAKDVAPQVQATPQPTQDTTDCAQWYAEDWKHPNQPCPQ